MTWEEWEAAYPVTVVTWEPKCHIYMSATRSDAECFKDNYETVNECGGLVVVKYNDNFYVIFNDEWIFRN